MGRLGLAELLIEVVVNDNNDAYEHPENNGHVRPLKIDRKTKGQLWKYALNARQGIFDQFTLF